MSRVIERVQNSGKTYKILDSAELWKAWSAGVKAKRMGLARVSPYYECEPLDHFWFAGYDGKNWEQAVKGQEGETLPA